LLLALRRLPRQRSRRNAIWFPSQLTPRERIMEKLMAILLVLVITLLVPSASSESMAVIPWLQYGGSAQHTGIGTFALVPPGRTFNGFEVLFTAGQAGQSLVLDSKGVVYSQYQPYSAFSPSVAWAYDTIAKQSIWKTEVSENSAALSPYAALSNDEALFFMATSRNILALDSQDGTVVWNITTVYVGGPASMTVGHNTGHLYASGGEYLACLDHLTGALLWTQRRPEHFLSGDAYYTPAALDLDESLGVVGYRDGQNNVAYLVAYELRTDAVAPRWQHKYYSSGYTMGFQYPSLVYAGRVFAPMTGGGLAIVDVASGDYVNNGSTSGTSTSYSTPTPMVINSTTEGIVFGQCEFRSEVTCAILVETMDGRGITSVPTNISLRGEWHAIPVRQQVLVTQDQYIVALFGSIDDASWGLMQVYRFNSSTNKLELLWQTPGTDQSLRAASSIVRAADGSFWMTSNDGLKQLAVSLT
jgi:outer membrane protein assembly factor BamB